MVFVRAIYHNGQLELLEPLALAEGTEVQVEIKRTELSIKTLLGDLLSHFEADSEPLDEGYWQTEIERQLAGKRPLSEIIIEERLGDS